jgi:Tfp pilus assembly protein FimT
MGFHASQRSDVGAARRSREGGRAIDRRASVRGGFTMVELLLVLGIVVIIGAMSWPSIQHAYEGIRLKKAAEQVLAAFGHARVQAMSKGLPQVFRFEQGTNRYTIEAVADDSAATELSGSVSSSVVTVGGGSSSASQSTGPCAHQIPDGFVFSSGQRTLDNRTATTESELSGSSQSSDAPPIIFYPDGQASEASVTVTDPHDGRSISVSIRGLTGISRLSQVFLADRSGP